MQQQPKQQTTARPKSYSMNAAAKFIKLDGTGRKLINFLKKHNYVNPDGPPIRELRENGLLFMKPTSYTPPSGPTRHGQQLMATSDGLTWLKNTVERHRSPKH